MGSKKFGGRLLYTRLDGRHGQRAANARPPRGNSPDPVKTIHLSASSRSAVNIFLVLASIDTMRRQYTWSCLLATCRTYQHRIVATDIFYKTNDVHQSFVYLEVPPPDRVGHAAQPRGICQAALTPAAP